MIGIARRRVGIAIALSLCLAPFTANAAGTPLNPRACPTGDWLHGPSIPQDVTNLLCSFLLAADGGDHRAIRAMAAVEIRADTALPQLLQQYAALRKAQGVERPDRIVLDVEQDGYTGDYLFRILDRYGPSQIVETISIRADTARLLPPYADTGTFDVAITGVRLGPL